MNECAAVIVTVCVLSLVGVIGGLMYVLLRLHRHTNLDQIAQFGAAMWEAYRDGEKHAPPMASQGRLATAIEEQSILASADEERERIAQGVTPGATFGIQPRAEEQAWSK